jgi:hypothetical protein
MVVLKKLWNTYSSLAPSAAGAGDSYILSGTYSLTCLTKLWRFVKYLGRNSLETRSFFIGSCWKHRNEVFFIRSISLRRWKFIFREELKLVFLEPGPP